MRRRRWKPCTVTTDPPLKPPTLPRPACTCCRPWRCFGSCTRKTSEACARGCFTVALTCAPGSPLGQGADAAIEVATGPEVVAGSTRLKAGTVQKVLLGMLSTGVFTRLGHVYDGRMVDVAPTSEKLRRTAAPVGAEPTGADH